MATLQQYQDRREAWLTALRSGRYLGAVGKLTRTIEVTDTRGNKGEAWGYCCLGVLCDIAAPELGYEWSERHTEAGTSGRWGQVRTIKIPSGSLGHGSYLPEEFRQWIGLKSETGHIREGTVDILSEEYGDYGEDQTLVLNGTFTEYIGLDNLNDEGGYTLAEIADVIEQNIQLLFIEAAWNPAVHDNNE